MRSNTFPVGQSPQPILGPRDSGALVQADASNTSDVYLGGQYVTPDATGTGGVRLAAGVSVPVEICGGDILFAVCAIGTQLVRVVSGGSA